MPRIILEVDGAETTLENFILANVHDADVESPDDDELAALARLKVGETMPCGMVFIKRIQ